MNYGLMFVGILTMCVPEDASSMRFALQGIAGLAIFFLGIAMTLGEERA
jgi:hypothetical protein